MSGKNDSENAGAFAKDKQYGRRLDETMRVGDANGPGEPFLLLAAKVAAEKIPTDIGDARQSLLLVQKIDPDTYAPVGQPFSCGTLGAAVADKIEELQPGELPAIVEAKMVFSKKWKTTAIVLQYVSGVGASKDELFAEFGLDGNAVSGMVDKLRPEGERIPFPTVV